MLLCRINGKVRRKECFLAEPQVLLEVFSRGITMEKPVRSAVEKPFKDLTMRSSVRIGGKNNIKHYLHKLNLITVISERGVSTRPPSPPKIALLFSSPILALQPTMRARTKLSSLEKVGRSVARTGMKTGTKKRRRRSCRSRTSPHPTRKNTTAHTPFFHKKGRGKKSLNFSQKDGRGKGKCGSANESI